MAPHIERIETFPIRLPRDLARATGTAGSPTSLGKGGGGYRWSSAYPVVYSEFIETALVRVTLSNGLEGWGESQAPVLPRVACAIINDLFAPLLRGAEFGGSRESIETIWDQMYLTMRVRGHTGSFLLDAMSGIDLALWDLAGKIAGKPVSSLISESPGPGSVPFYLSGLSGANIAERVSFAREYFECGVRLFKVYFDASPEALAELLNGLREGLGNDARLAVDGLWHLSLEEHAELLRTMEAIGVHWLECPFPPEDFESHRELTKRYALPLALGESQRTPHELRRYFDESLLCFVQPDLGRCGITGSVRIAALAAQHGVEVVPHVSIALGPQIAAAVHLAAALPNCKVCEYNPNVFLPSNRYLESPLLCGDAEYRIPATPGLGTSVALEILMQNSIPFAGQNEYLSTSGSEGG